MTKQIEITLDVAKKVLAVVDAGLVKGIGVAEPGKMCVEAAVCYALGLPHGDNPSCVAPALRSLKIRLNDSSWSSNEARTKGLRRLALAQLGSAGFLDESEFINRVCGLVIRKVVPGALRVAASVIKNEKHKKAMIASAAACEAFSSEKSLREARPILIEAKKAAATTAADAKDAAAAADAAAAYAYAAAADAKDAAAAADAAAAYAYAAATAADAAAATDAAYAAVDAYADAAATAYAAAYAAANAAAYAAADAAYAADAAAAAAYAAASAAAAYAAADAADADAAAAYAAADAAAYAAAKLKSVIRDKSLAAFCEDIVQILIGMNAPGCQWLDLTEAGA